MRSVPKSRHLPVHAVFITICLLFTAFTQVSARTISVPETVATIKGAMLTAQPGDIILVACGTYHEYDIQIKPGVSLWSGTLQPGCVTIDTQGRGRAFIIADADSTTALVGLTIRNGRMLGDGEQGRGGGILCLNSSPKITNCILERNSARLGGAIYCDAGSTPLLENCLFNDNDAINGGAVFWRGRGGGIVACALRDNQALLGGGIYGQGAHGLRVTGCFLANNEAGNAGGGLYLDDCRASIVNTVLAENWGGLGGGALAMTGASPLIAHCTLVDNDVEFDGAALATSDTAPELDHCILANHRRDLLRTGSGTPRFNVCNLYGNAGGDWNGELASQSRQRQNVSSDPRFCAPKYGNYHLDGASYCLPENRQNGSGKVIGALGVGCSGSQGLRSEMADERSGFNALRAGL